MKRVALTLLILVVAASAIVALDRVVRRRPARPAAPAPEEAAPTTTLQRPNIHQVNRHLDYLKRSGQSPAQAPPSPVPEGPPASP